MAYRTGHGNGAGEPRIEVLPPDELPDIPPSVIDHKADLAPRTRHGYFAKGNRAAKLSKIKPGKRSLADEERCDPAFKAFARDAKKYSRHRRGEYLNLFGEISAGVCSMLDSAAMTLGASKFVYQRAAELGDPDLFKKASALACDARQNELAAWELAVKEAKGRPQKSAHDILSEALSVPAEVSEAK